MQTIQVGNIHAIDVRAQFPDAPGFPERPFSDIQALVIHHSVTDPATDPYVALRAIYENHQNQGWPGIGYHLLVSRDGRIFLAGGLETIRAHVYGRNADSVGICLLGYFTYTTPDLRQLIAARRLLAELDFAFAVDIPTFPHYDYALPGQGTQCPGTTAPLWLPLILYEAYAPHWDLLVSEVTGTEAVAE